MCTTLGRKMLNSKENSASIVNLQKSFANPKAFGVMRMRTYKFRML
jgi:hypothetical protein